ncbi:S8 family serine peptidase [Pediococcus inopinatus]|uniref:S8 family serine peptidase n=1 Tax=Pediococcus inopinatus TaxID=114090 RepID=UPI002B26154E|nr:S8 family serine peptidase [Pediococcus inopinatus]WPC18319.1 S8 family serine peptidase [Pediococcus inopinatus]
MGMKLKRRVSEEPKEHYKMYKEGKHWVISGIMVFSAGMMFTMSTTSASADTSAADTVTRTATVKNGDKTVQDQNASSTKTTGASENSQGNTVLSSEKQNVTSDDQAVGQINNVEKNTDEQDESADTTAPEAATEQQTTDDKQATDDQNTSETGDQATEGNTSNKQNTDSQTDNVAQTVTNDTAVSEQSTAAVQDDPESDTVSVDKSTTEQDHVKGNVASAWEQGYQGQGMVVAVIDSGMDTDDKDFRLSDDSTAAITQQDAEQAISNLGYGTYISPKFPFVYNYVSHDDEWIQNDDSPHGAHVSGIIASNGQANADGDEFTTGVAPEAQLLEMRVFAQYADEKADDIAQAIRDAVFLGADVIQMSLGVGAPDQQLTDIEQQAVQYAVDNGVFVSISASNNGNSGSIVSANNGNPGSNQLAYLPVNSSTIADPGVSNNAMTVAAENSAVGEDDDMASFSSWGPLSDYSLKPDISAPGVDIISTVNDDQYTTMSGTSMAGPYDAGAAALVLQKLKSTTSLQGADLVKATKLALMNTATPMKDNAYGALVSPRRQGAGEINVGNATADQVTIEGNNNTGSVSLYAIGDETKFSVTFTNLSDQSHSYTFDDYGGPMTELQADDGTVYDAYLAGAVINTDQSTITVAANSTQTVNFTLTLAGLKNNEPIEGYLGFTSDDADSPNLVVPYLGYYGDLTDEQVFDDSANEADSIFSGNYFVNEENYPRGIADENSLKTLVNLDGDYDWSEVAKLYQDGKVAFSPNNDQQSDILKPYEFIKQNLDDLTVQILNDKGEVVRTLTDEKGIQKSIYQDGGTGNQDITLSPSMRDNPDTLNWDGTLFDQTTGQTIVAPDGEYQYKFIGTLTADGEEKTQTASYSVIIDTTAPTITNMSYDPNTQTVSADYTDTGSGFTDYSYATLTINDKSFPVELNDVNNGDSFVDDTKMSGRINIKLTTEELSNFSSSATQLVLALSDVADNTQTSQLVVSGQTDGNSVSVWNATNGLAYSVTSPDYDADTGTYTLKGSAQNDFYLNGKLVQVVDGEYEVPVSATSTTPLIFSSDSQGNDVLLNWANATPEAEFAWQHVNGANQNWGLTVYGVTPNSRTFTVQALVTKGNNVQVFAQDYFTGTEYTATVQDGIATFTGTLPDDVGEVLLVGWTEVDGPTYNDKQFTDTDSISDANYFGVIYVSGAEDLPVLTSVDQFGVSIANATADPDEIGTPGDLAMHSLSDLTTRADPNTAEIVFDNVADNDFTRYGEDAVSDGYYNPGTQQFTVTGRVATDVTGLTILGDDAHEDATANQVKLNSDGTFEYSFTMNGTEDRGVSYIVTNNDGSTVRGMFDVILDTTQPNLTVPIPDAQYWTVDSDGNYQVYTNQPTVTITGQGYDNLDGYRMFVNDNNFYREYHNSGVNYIADFFTNADGTVTQRVPNSYPAHDFSETYSLFTSDDQSDYDVNDGDSDNVFNVSVVDQVGNTVTKTIIVHYKVETADTAPTDFKVVAPEFTDSEILNDRSVQDAVSYSTDNGVTWQAYTGSATVDGNYYRVRDKFGNEVAGFVVKQPVVVTPPDTGTTEPNTSVDTSTTGNETNTTPGEPGSTPVDTGSKTPEDTETTTPVDTGSTTPEDSGNTEPEGNTSTPVQSTTDGGSQTDTSKESTKPETVVNSKDTEKNSQQDSVLDLVSEETSKKQKTNDTKVVNLSDQKNGNKVVIVDKSATKVTRKLNLGTTDTKAAELPQTDEHANNGLFAWIGAVMLAGLGIFGSKRRKRN